MLLLSVIEEATGEAWYFRASVDGQRAVVERVPYAEIAEIAEQVQARLAPPLVTFPGQLAAREAAEREVGRLLGGLVGRGRLNGVFAEARTQEPPVRVLVTADGPRSVRLPWELLAWPTDGRSVEDAGEGVVVRQSHGKAFEQPRAEDDLRVLCWSPTPDDPHCAQAIASLEAELRDGFVRVTDLGSPPGPVPGRADLLVVVAHGRAEDGFGAILCGGDDRDMAELASLLGPIQRRSLGVVLQVCEGGSYQIEALRGLADALLRAGGGFCVAPWGRLGVEASVAFTAALVRSFRRGAALPTALIAGRTAVRARGGTHPEERPSRLLAFVADARALEAEPPVAVPDLPGWGRASAEVQLVARRASRLARDRGLPWVGLEHLLCALTQGEGGPRAREMALALTSARAAETLQGLGPYHVARADAPVVPPRMQAIAARLGDGASLDDLWALLIADATSGLHALTHQDLADLFHGSPILTAQRRVPGPGRPATGFEVLWGPEDGRRVFPSVQGVLGRKREGGSATVLLYEALVAWDRALSSAHLSYLGPGRFHTTAGLCRYRSGDRPVELRLETGELQIAVGEVILLGNTWLRAIDEKTSQVGVAGP